MKRIFCFLGQVANAPKRKFILASCSSFYIKNKPSESPLDTIMKTILKPHGFFSIKLKKTKSQHLVAQLNINKKEGLFLIDTWRLLCSLLLGHLVLEFDLLQLLAAKN